MCDERTRQRLINTMNFVFYVTSYSMKKITWIYALYSQNNKSYVLFHIYMLDMRRKSWFRLVYVFNVP